MLLIELLGQNYNYFSRRANKAIFHNISTTGMSIFIVTFTNRLNHHTIYQTNLTYSTSLAMTIEHLLFLNSTGSIAIGSPACVGLLPPNKKIVGDPFIGPQPQHPHQAHVDSSHCHGRTHRCLEPVPRADPENGNQGRQYMPSFFFI